MANNGEAIQLLSGSRRRLDVTVPGENRPMFFGLAVLILIGVLWGAATFYLSRLETKVVGLDNELVTLENKRDKKFEKEALVWDKRLSIAGGLIRNHVIWSQALHKIEALTPPAVQFSNFHVVLQDNTIDLKATAPSYTAIAKAVAALAEDAVFTDVALSKVSSLPSGFLEYSLKITFNRNKFLLVPVEEKRP